MPRDLTVSETAELIDKLTAEIREKFGDEVDITFMADPCTATFCPFCSLDDCGLRAAQFQHRTVLNVDAAVCSESVAVGEEPGKCGK